MVGCRRCSPTAAPSTPGSRRGGRPAPTSRARCAAARARLASSRPRCCGSTRGPRPGWSRRTVLPSVDAAVRAVYLALREEAAPSGLRIYDAAEAALHFDGLALPAGHALLCAGTAGPTDLAACDRDLITSAVIAEGGAMTDQALAELWWRRAHAGEPTPGPQPTLQVMATPSRLRRRLPRGGRRARRAAAARPAPTSRGSTPTARSCSSRSCPTTPTRSPSPSARREAAGGWLLGARAAQARQLPARAARRARPRPDHEPGRAGRERRGATPTRTWPCRRRACA